MQLSFIYSTDDKLHLWLNNVRYVSVESFLFHQLREWESRITNTKRKGTLLNQIKAVCQLVKEES